MDIPPYREAAARPRVRVVVWNDAKTTLELLVAVLQDRFGFSAVRAYALALAVKQDGWTDIGTYDEPVAEEHVAQCLLLAEQRGFPLRAAVALLDDEPRPTLLIRMRNRHRRLLDPGGIAWVDPT